jgi:hypothetical protein
LTLIVVKGKINPVLGGLHGADSQESVGINIHPVHPFRFGLMFQMPRTATPKIIGGRTLVACHGPELRKDKQWQGGKA